MKGKWTVVDFVIISALLLLGAVSVNWFADLGVEPLDEWGAMIFEVDTSSYTSEYESYGIDYKTATPACKRSLAVAGDVKSKLRNGIDEATERGDQPTVAKLNRRMAEIDDDVRQKCLGGY